MLGPDIPLLTMSPRPRHVTAAVTAGILSVLAHTVLVVVLRTADLDWGHVLARLPLPEETRRVLLGDIVPEAPAVKTPAATMELTLDMATAVDSLGLPMPDAILDPPPAASPLRMVETRGLAEPEVPDTVSTWQPRQAMLAIEHKIADDRAALLARVPTALIERVADAPDIVLPVDLRTVASPAAPTTPAAREALDRRPETAAIVLPEPTVAPPAPLTADIPTETVVREAIRAFEERPADVTALTPIEAVLSSSVQAFATRRDRAHRFFKIDVRRLGEDVLPTIPKDVIFMQDVSNSMAEQRLFFCRAGLRACLDELGPEDRFEIVAFRETPIPCFGGWRPADASHIGEARAYIETLRSGGNTDIFRSMHYLFSMPREPGRPVIVILISDGLPTAGMTGSSEIIAEFTALNDGTISVFSIGTVQTANRYLLDLLSYSNRGETRMSESGRWEIDALMLDVMRSIRRPIMAEVDFRIPVDSRVDIYPVETANLYLDRPLTLYGRAPEGTKRFVFQAVGRGAGGAPVDMVFDLALDGEPLGDRDGGRDMAREWARQKIYHHLARHAREPDPNRLRDIRETARRYDVDVPHRGRW